MKRFFTFCFAFLALGAVAAQAQEEDEELDESIQFVDADGNIVPDGTVLTINEIDENGQMHVPLYVKNMTDETQAGQMEEDLTALPNGDFSSCAFGNCLTWSDAGIHYSSKNGMLEAGASSPILTEWIPSAYGSWTATLQILVLNVEMTVKFGQTIEQPGDVVIGYGPKVTVVFNYSDNAAISDLNADGTTEVARYDVCGRRLAEPQKGLNVVQLSNGKAVKVLVK